MVGAYRTERGNFPDEAGHFMNGMLVRDYLTDGLGENPMQFARQYYLNYPKIAPGMWPPLYHGLLGIFLLPGWPPETAALLLIGLAAAWTGWRLFRILSLLTTRRLAFAIAAAFLCTPVIVNLSSAVMLDIVIAAFALEATYWLALFVGSGHWRHAALYGLFAAGGCLTKGNGLAILLMPPLVAIFARRLDLFRRPGLYLLGRDCSARGGAARDDELLFRRDDRRLPHDDLGGRHHADEILRVVPRRGAGPALSRDRGPEPRHGHHVAQD